MRSFLILSAFLIVLFERPASAIPIVAQGETWHYWKGRTPPPASWQTLPEASLEAAWFTGPGGFGYGDGDDTTVLADMAGAEGYRTLYIRREFTVGPGDFGETAKAILSIDYDDAFVAYLDGVEIARSANAPGMVGTEPAYTDGPSSTHEAGSPERTDLGLASVALAEGTHILAVLGMNESASSSDFSLLVNLLAETPAPPLPPLHWTLADSPITLSGTFVIANGQTLTIDAGVEVRCPAGIDAIRCEGALRANGAENARIRFVPSSFGGTWGRVNILASETTSLSYCDFERANSSGIIRGRNTAVRLEHCRFVDVDVQMVDLVSSSCDIEHCEFDSISSGELLHFSNMPSNGHARIAYSRFGAEGIPATGGYNDIIDFTGGNRPGPIPRFIGNVFLSAVDDVFDMDSTDAHIEGNIFMNVRKESARASSSNPITTGAENGDDSELVIVRNIFYNCEHNVMIKDHGSILMQNNTTLSVTPNPLSNNESDEGNEASGLVLFGEPWRGFPYGDGVYYQGNIAAGLEVADPWPLLSSALAANGTFLRRDFNCIEGFPQPGFGNITDDPLFADRTGITSENIREKLQLQLASPCLGAGPNGLDMGALVPMGASISGEPESSTTATAVTLTVAGPGIWSYQWRLNGGPWSDEISLVPQAIWDGAPLTDTMFDKAPPIELSDLGEGDYRVEVRGRNSAGDWQETPTVSKTWTVRTVQSQDADADGLPDLYELANGFDPNDPTDASSDADADGASNLNEYLAGTSPNDPASRFVLRVAYDINDGLLFSFDGLAGKTYQLQTSDDLREGSWTPVRTIESSINERFEIAQTNAAEKRFYRLITPAPAEPLP